MARPLIMLGRRTRVGSASLPQKRESNYRWRKLIFWLGKAARLNFSRRTRQARCRYSSSMTVHTFPHSAPIRTWPTLLGRVASPNYAALSKEAIDQAIGAPKPSRRPFGCDANVRSARISERHRCCPCCNNESASFCQIGPVVRSKCADRINFHQHKNCGSGPATLIVKQARGRKLSSDDDQRSREARRVHLIKGGIDGATTISPRALYRGSAGGKFGHHGTRADTAQGFPRIW